MSAVRQRTPIESGFCAHSGDHARCPVILGTRDRPVACACACHTYEPAVDDAVVTAGPAATSASQARQVGVCGPLQTPGSPPWWGTVSASKIAAIVGLSPYESRFSLWHRMAGLAAGESDSDEKRRGHYLEPACADWFADQHPELLVIPTGTWTAAGRPWQSATPDRVLFRCGVIDPSDRPVALLECKTDAGDQQWGEPGSDEIPPGYRAQVIWQLDTVGADTCHVAVLSAYLEFREYVVRYDADEAAFLRQEAAAFLASLPGGSSPERPDIDSHGATYQVIRDSHPDIDDVDVEIDPDVAALYTESVGALKAAKDCKRLADSLLLDTLGRARRAVCAGRRIAIRVPPPGGGSPYLKPSPAPKRAAVPTVIGAAT